MKTISVKQPWAYLICSGIKDIENRTWRTNFRGRILIHASAQETEYELTKEQNDCVIDHAKTSQLSMAPRRSAIIGSVEIVNCVINHPSIWAEPRTLIMEFSHVHLWNWVLANPIMFERPITKVKGKLRFWEYENIDSVDDNGITFCNCRLPIDEKHQVTRVLDHYRCNYCGGVWYK